MKHNSYFRPKTSIPQMEVDNGGHNSLASLMGRFRNEGQKEDYCLRAKPDMPLANMLGSKNQDPYELQTRDKTFQVFNKENMRTNNPQDSKFQQLTPRRQQPLDLLKRERSPQHPKSPLKLSTLQDASSKFVFKAKQNKTLGNLIEMAENYSTMRVTSPNKVIIKKSSFVEPHFPQRKVSSGTSLGLEGEELEKEISSLKENLANLVLQSLPKEAVQSAIHIEIEDFLSRLIPSRSALQREDKKLQQPKHESSLLLLTSQAMPVNFSFDIRCQSDVSKGAIDLSTDKMESSVQRNPSLGSHQQSEAEKEKQYISNPLQASQAESQRNDQE